MGLENVDDLEERIVERLERKRTGTVYSGRNTSYQSQGDPITEAFRRLFSQTGEMDQYGGMKQ